MFRFKQFTVDQTGCAMKINTDGVLLGAFAEDVDPERVLDIGAGTGVIALMLAQKFSKAKIDAVEIDGAAAQTAGRNFKSAVFSDRLTIFNEGFQQYFEKYPGKKYDLIVSNPPFYINSLESPGKRINLAKHTDEAFFEDLIAGVARHLTPAGICYLILPVVTSNLIKSILIKNNLHLGEVITIRSFATDEPHREVLVFGQNKTEITTTDFIIYAKPKEYTDEYENILKDFFIIF